MQTRICLLLSIFFLHIATFAQEQQTTSERGITAKFGIRAGINLSNLYVEDVEDENMKVGLNLGLIAKIPLVRGLSLQPELLYSSKGSKITYNNLLGQGEYRFNLNYVEMPLLAVINLAPNFNVHGGVYGSYLVSSNIKEMDDDGNINEIADLDEDAFNRFDYGIAGGFGVDVQHFTIGARYTYGLKEVGKSGGVPGIALKDSKNSVITVYLGFAF